MPQCHGLLSLSLLFGCAVSIFVACDGATRPAGGAVILFQRSTDSDIRIYSARPDGSGARQLTAGGLADRSPAISPDGRTILFSRASATPPVQGTPDPGIFAMDPDGSNVRRITSSPFGAGDPRWSPDGSEFVFSQTDDAWMSHLMISDREGVDVRQLTTVDGNHIHPDWSPDGRRIVFASARDPENAGRYRLFSIGVEGDGEVALSNDACEANAFQPRWSPNGARIAYTCSSGLEQMVYTALPDGSGRQQLSSPYDESVYITEFSPVWSPDGTRIALGRVSAPSVIDIYVRAFPSGVSSPLIRSTPDDIPSDWRQY